MNLLKIKEFLFSVDYCVICVNAFIQHHVLCTDAYGFILSSIMELQAETDTLYMRLLRLLLKNLETSDTTECTATLCQQNVEKCEKWKWNWPTFFYFVEFDWELYKNCFIIGIQNQCEINGYMNFYPHTHTHTPND